MKRIKFNDGQFDSIQLGIIKETNNNVEEDIVRMSKTTFLTLLSSLSRTTEDHAVLNIANELKDKLTELTFKSNRSYEDLNQLLSDTLNYAAFSQDILLFEKEYKPTKTGVKTVGKINLQDIV
jgi:hypothetical protein